MRKALVVGINHYDYASPLHGCVDDAHSVKAILERHGDGTVNFDIRLLTGTGPQDAVPRRLLKDSIVALFADPCDIALFYFAGHGAIESTGGFLCGSDVTRADDGVPMSELLSLANASPARDKVILLDSCH